ncbi:MAG: cupin domain-containing protein [Planctomycetota bacterium]|jgi:D-lyxose ketol-isomerase
MKSMNRREMMGLSAGAAIACSGLINGCTHGEKENKMSTAKLKYRQYKNEDFYKADGIFDSDKARQAYYEMMEYFNYPVVERLKNEEFWAIDFGLGRFTEVGMAGIFWVNNEKDCYFGHEIYLLPGQRITEHAHVKTEAAGPKMEAWQPRHGMIYVYGEGEPTAGVEADIPEEDKKYWIARTKKKLMPGEVASLKAAESKHWMMAGPEGAIVTEYATYHDGEGLRFSTPGVRL